MMGARYDLPLDTSEKLRIERWSLNREGYDKHGSYWGVDYPLYRVTDSEGHQRFIRSLNREDVKRWFPKAKFYR